MVTATTTQAPPTCDARVGTFAGEWSEMPLWCSTSVGLVTYTDTYGIERRYCRHHKGLVLYRYAPAPAKDECAICKGPVDELAIRIDGGPTVLEVCWRCQEKGDSE